MLRRRALLNLGAAVGATGSIPRDRGAAAVAAARRLRRHLDDAGAELTVAVATAALRDASNGLELVGRLEAVIGSPISILDGREEARLCFIGQRAGVWNPPGLALSLDLGGGSLELAVGDDHRLVGATSIPVGANRLAAELALGDPLRAEDVSAIRRRVGEALTAAEGIVDAAPARRVVASGGTVRALARLATARARRCPDAASEVNQVELPAAQVEELAVHLGALGLDERLQLAGMPARRAPVVPVGAAILAALARELDVERFVVSEWGLREGALLDALSRG